METRNVKDKIIKTITIDIAGTEVEVTPEQAKNLHEALGDLLGVKQGYNLAPIVIRERPVWPYPTPYIDRWQLNYNTTTNGVKMAIN